MNIMETKPEGFTEPTRYFIDCPFDMAQLEPEVRRIEIPRELAKYIYDLQQQIESLKLENNRLLNQID